MPLVVPPLRACSAHRHPATNNRFSRAAQRPQQWAPQPDPPAAVSPRQPRGHGDGLRGQSQAQPSPFSLAKAGLATSLPGPPQLPLLYTCIHPPMQLPCSAAAMQAGMWCQCHLVAGAPGLSSSPTASHGCPPAIAGAPMASLCHGWHWEAGSKEGSCGVG